MSGLLPLAWCDREGIGDRRGDYEIPARPEGGVALDVTELHNPVPEQKDGNSDTGREPDY